MSLNNKDIELLNKMIKESKRIVFFGGAGVSTESGIPDFRSTDGLYNQQYDYPPEQILSDTFFWFKPVEFYKFYKDKMIYKNAKPNITHNVLAKLEEQGKLQAVVTQNIDNLHELAGSKNVYHLHGSIYSNKCVKCHKHYGIDTIIDSVGVPHCDCGGIIKPDVTLYGEQLDEVVVNKAIDAIYNCDMLIIGGTSLTVYPAAYYINYFRGKYLVLINKDKTSLDSKANLTFHNKLGEVFSVISL